MDKLRICRQIRNYIQHHEDGISFLAATDDMTGFLETLILQELSKEKLAKDLLYKLAPVSFGQKLSEVQTKFAKGKRFWYPVTDLSGKYCGILTALSLVKALDKGKKTDKLEKVLDSKELSAFSVGCVEKNTPLKYLCGEDLIVLSPDGKYLGIVKW